MFSYSFSFIFLLCLLFNQSWTLILATDMLLQFVLLRLLVRTYFSFMITLFFLSYRHYLSAHLTHIAPGHCFSFVIFVSRLFPLATCITSMIRHLVDSWTDTASYPHYYTSLLPTLLSPANGPSSVL